MDSKRLNSNDMFVGLLSTDYCHLPADAHNRLCENEQPTHNEAIIGKDWRASLEYGACKTKWKSNDF